MLCFQADRGMYQELINIAHVSIAKQGWAHVYRANRDWVNSQDLGRYGPQPPRCSTDSTQ